MNMPKHICCECGSNNIRILTRSVRGNTRWYTHCCNCTEQGGDYRSLTEAVASCEAKLAEARVGGVLRGGHVVEDRFCYHGPQFVSVRMREVRELRMLEDNPRPEPHR